MLALVLALVCCSAANAAGLTSADEGDLLIAEQSLNQVVLKDLARPGSERPAVFSGGGLVKGPADTVVAPNGDVYLTSEKAPAVVKIDARTGKQVLVTQGGHLIAPVAIDLDGQGNILVADYQGAARGGAVIKIQPFTGKQTVLASAGQYNDPIGIAFDFVSGRSIWVADANTGSGGSGTLWRYDIKGKFSEPRNVSPSFDPWAVAMAPNGDTWTADVVGFGEHGAIQVRHPDGTLKRTIGLGNLDPAGIDVGQDGSVYVSDSLRFTGSGFERGASVGVFGVNPVTGATRLVAPADSPKGVTVVPPLPTYVWDNCCGFGPDAPDSSLDMMQIGTGTYVSGGKRLVYHHVWFFGSVLPQDLEGVCLGGLNTNVSSPGPEYGLCGDERGFGITPNRPGLRGGGRADVAYLMAPARYVVCCTPRNPVELTGLFVAYDPAKVGNPAQLGWQALTRHVDKGRCKATGGGGHDVGGGCVDLLPDRGEVWMPLRGNAAAAADTGLGNVAQVDSDAPQGLRLLPPAAPPADTKGPKLKLLGKTVKLDRKGRGRLRVSCPRGEPAGCNEITARIRAVGVLAHRTRIAAGTSATLRFRVGRSRSRLGRDGRLTVRVVLDGHDQLANRGRTSKRLSLTT